MADTLTEDDIDALIGVRIRGELDMQDRTQAWLADKVGVTRTAVSYWLSGRSSMTAAKLLRVASILGIGVDRLFPPMPGRGVAPAQTDG